MTHFKRTLLISLTAIFSMISSSAFAHAPTTESSFFSGLLHPLSGLDHLIAMFAVGLWAAQQQNKTQYLIPISFLAFILLGFGLGMATVSLPLTSQPSIEIGIALSVLILGLLIVKAVRLPTYIAVTITGLFALYHGVAHGVEMTATSTSLFAIGFTLSTALLHLAGANSAPLLKAYSQKLSQLTGISIALSGAYFLIS